eukprot:COSAG02_NODE_2785_length_8032_cov_173.978066_6_plen_325_part_00
MQQWRQEAEAQLVAEAGTAGSRAHGTRGERRGAAEIEWVEAQGGTAAAAALAGAPPSLSELLLSALVEEVPTGQDKPLPLNRNLLQPVTGETPLSKPPKDMVKAVKQPKNLDQHLKAALMEVGIIDRSWTGRPVQELQNDEICADLRSMTRQLAGIMKRNEATVMRLLDEAKKAGVTRKTESELSGARAKEIEDRYLKRKRAQKQRKKSKKKKVQGGTYELTDGQGLPPTLSSWFWAASALRDSCLASSACSVGRMLISFVCVCDATGSKKNQSLGTSAIQALASGKVANPSGTDAAAAPAAASAPAPGGGGDPAFSSEGRGVG